MCDFTAAARFRFYPESDAVTKVTRGWRPRIENTAAALFENAINLDNVLNYRGIS